MKFCPGGGMADTHDSKSCAARHESSTLSPGTSKEFASGFGLPRFARRLNCKGFWAKKSVGDFVLGKENFLIICYTNQNPVSYLKNANFAKNH